MAAERKTEAVKGAEALMKALDVIELVARAPTPPKVAAIAQELGIPRSTAYRITGALAQRSYLRLDTETQGFRLGYRLFELSYSSWRDLDISRAAGPAMEALRDQTGETVVLAVRTGEKVVIVDQRECRHDIRPAIQSGHSEPITRSLFGLSILSFLKPKERDAVLEDSTAGSLAQGDLAPAVLLRLAAARGYALQASQFDETVSGVGAPILDFHGTPFASVVVVGPSRRLPESQLHRLSPLVMEAARRITRNAGNPVQSIDPRPRPRGLSKPKVRKISEPDCLLGEAPLWDPTGNRLYWLDIFGPAIHSWDMATQRHLRRACGDLPGTLCFDDQGQLLIAEPSAILTVDPDTLMTTRVLADLDTVMRGRRFNDGAVDPAGRLLLGVMDLAVAADQGFVGRFDRDSGGLEPLLTGLTLPNGIRWSPDGRSLYVIDSIRGLVLRHAYDPTSGALGPRESFAHVPAGSGMPDGLAIDQEGHLWVALWDGWSIVRFDPKGRISAQYEMPVPRPTSLCFGGPGYGTLFVTTAYVRLTADQLEAAPLSGSVLAFEPGVKGLPSSRFPIR